MDSLQSFSDVLAGRSSHCQYKHTVNSHLVGGGDLEDTIVLLTARQSSSVLFKVDIRVATVQYYRIISVFNHTYRVEFDTVDKQYMR